MREVTLTSLTLARSKRITRNQTPATWCGISGVRENRWHFGSSPLLIPNRPDLCWSVRSVFALRDHPAPPRPRPLDREAASGREGGAAAGYRGRDSEPLCTCMIVPPPETASAKLSPRRPVVGQCRRGNRAAGRPRLVPGDDVRFAGARSSAAAGFGPLDLADRTSRDVITALRPAKGPRVHAPPGPPATSLEASRAVLARPRQGSAVGDGLAICKSLHFVAFVAEGRGDRGSVVPDYCAIPTSG